MTDSCTCCGANIGLMFDHEDPETGIVTFCEECHEETQLPQRRDSGMKNESQWLDELLFIRRRCEATSGYWTMSWLGYVNETARECAKQFPQIGQSIQDCLTMDGE